MARPRKAPPRWLEAARLRGDGGGADWLSRALSRAGVMPLEEAELAISARRISLDGQLTTEALAPVREGARVTLDGHPVSLAWRTRVLVFHKPAGLITQGTDPERIGTVFDGLRAVLSQDLLRFGWHAVGRLDRDTTGLLLFTNDERFVQHATSPETHLDKRYVAKVGAGVTDEKLAPLRRGVRIDDGGMTRPAKATVRGTDAVELVLTEGRFHQVKRMLNAVGLPTLALHREAVGSLELDVAEGQVRELGDDEVAAALGFTPRRGHGG